MSENNNADNQISANQSQPSVAAKNGSAIAGFVLGMISIVACIIPILGLTTTIAGGHFFRQETQESKTKYGYDRIDFLGNLLCGDRNGFPNQFRNSFTRR